jgi:arginyl-tRNA synthetase
LAAAADRIASVRAELASTFKTALRTAFPAMDVEPFVAATNNPQFGDYQCNNAMALFGRMRGKVC